MNVIDGIINLKTKEVEAEQLKKEIAEKDAEMKQNEEKQISMVLQLKKIGEISGTKLKQQRRLSMIYQKRRRKLKKSLPILRPKKFQKVQKVQVDTWKKHKVCWRPIRSVWDS